MSIALTWAKGRVLQVTPSHLRQLDQQLYGLRGSACGIDDAMVPLLREAKQSCQPDDWRMGVQLVGLTPLDVEILEHAAPRHIGPHREATRALRGIPLPNPFTQVWELRQMRSMYAAAENILEDAFCDLALELAPRLGWDRLAQLTLYHQSARSLQLRVQEQRDARGEPGDPRREPMQRY